MLRFTLLSPVHLYQELINLSSGMQPGTKRQHIRSVLTRITYFLKALYIFFPGIIFLLLGLFTFLKLPQGKDIIYQSTDGANSWLSGLYLVLATIFWVFTTWFTARFIAYNRNDLYLKAPWVLFHFPRLLGYCIFLVLGLAVFLIDDVKGKLNGWSWMIAITDLIIYIIFHTSLENSLKKKISDGRWRRLNLIRNMVRVLIILSCALVVIQWNNKHVNVLLYTLPVFQIGFLFLVIVRHPLYSNHPQYVKGQINNKSYWDRYLGWVYSGASDNFDVKFEKPVFIVYHALAFCALFFYMLSINYLPFARELSSFPLVLLAFGILLGIINFLALISYRKNVNLNFLILAVIVIAGFFFEAHPVRLKADPQPGQAYAGRPGFRKYLENWIGWHKASIDSSAQYPVFFTLADGGASRSGYWAALVLGNLHEKTRYNPGNYRSYFSDHLFCLSGASGGSVGNASFLSALEIQQSHPDLKVDSLCVKYLDNDFLSYPLARLLGPDLIKPVFGWMHGWGDRAAALEIGMDLPTDKDGFMGKMMRNNFSQLIPDDRNQLPIICINTTRVDDGGPGVVSTMHLDSSNQIFGKRIDVLNMVPPGYQLRISTAMVLGARFPYMSPGGKLGNSYFVDGGYFDNSGAGVVHEMLLELSRIAGDTLDPLNKTVKKMQFYVIHLSNSPYARPDTSSHSIHPLLNDLATPLLTLAGSYNSQTSINDARLINYLKELNRERNSYLIFNLYRRDTAESLSMNWVISNRARNVMFERVHKKPALDSVINRMRTGRSDNFFRGLEKEN